MGLQKINHLLQHFSYKIYTIHNSNSAPIYPKASYLGISHGKYFQSEHNFLFFAVFLNSKIDAD